MIKFTDDEIKQIENHGLTVEEVMRQIELIKSGVKIPRLVKPAVIGDGIVKTDDKKIEELISFWEENSGRYSVVKFVPASGAATRMFKSLNKVYHNYKSITFSQLKKEAETDKELSKAKIFFENLDKFPFAEDIPHELKKIDDDTDLIKLLDFILGSHGLNFGNIPKGLIKFHRYGNKSATPVEEHVFEAENLLSSQNPKKLHFTISPQFEEQFKTQFGQIAIEKYKQNFVFEYSFQNPSTDTIVWDGEKLLKNKNGEIVFRPGGHGALIENLNNLDADLIFIKNIDNVAKRELAVKSIEYKKLLGGYALSLIERMHEILNKIDKDELFNAELHEALQFAENELNIKFSDEEKSLNENALKEILFQKLNRPLRVAAMVKNTGEPGGGPFWIETENGGANLQIVEKAQIDLSDEKNREILQTSTHFNPVDIACFVKDFKDEKFDLKKFVNPDYGIITEKHLEGKDVKVLELPGLWNAAMFDWITVFVDVPLFTFTPVKEVIDLLREEHKNWMNG